MDAATGRPDPAVARTPAEYVDAMRRLKRWTGAGYRELEKRAGGLGEALPRSTLTAALVRDSLPREELVAAFVRACGGDEDLVRHWVANRRRIAGGHPPPQSPRPQPQPPPPAAEPAEPVDGAEPAEGFEGVEPAEGFEPAGAGAHRRGGTARVVLLLVVALAAAALVAAVGTVRAMTRPDEPGPTGDRSGPAAPPSAAVPGWLPAGGARSASLADEQGIDFDTGGIGYADSVDRFDLKLSRRADRLTVEPPGAAAVLDAPGDGSPGRCLTAPRDGWDSTLDGLYGLAAGALVCVSTADGRAVLITVERPPDGLSPVLAFRYTVWKRARS